MGEDDMKGWKCSDDLPLVKYWNILSLFLFMNRLALWNKLTFFAVLSVEIL